MSDGSSDLGGARPGAVERDIEQVGSLPILFRWARKCCGNPGCGVSRLGTARGWESLWM
ncbi:hypothetical protein E2562_002092 [Oryza meyeriana var. granulata]|uniref:Uncharacterized protein n=1 Tax=Oryza meyeriana var. granulata TaxID=110450 RepID=A0A6G1EEK4_9ORYZ|nr:hypothetical protein E2562_002092 [Oryza meyeriana var. granulata]